MNATFSDLANSPMPSAHVSAMVVIDFARPDGSIFSSDYDMNRDIDVATINGNITDGYRIVHISKAQ